MKLLEAFRQVIGYTRNQTISDFADVCERIQQIVEEKIDTYNGQLDETVVPIFQETRNKLVSVHNTIENSMIVTSKQMNLIASLEKKLDSIISQLESSSGSKPNESEDEA